MTIDEAIERYTSNAEYERTHGNLQGCLEFRQLAEWLKELKTYRETQVTDAVDRVTIKEYLESFGNEQMTAEEYRQRMMQAFHNADCGELIAVCVLPTEKEFEHLEWLLKNHYKQEPCEDCISRQAVLEAFGLSEKSRKYGGDHSGYDTLMKYEIQDILEDLPSVTPQQRLILCKDRMPDYHQLVLTFDGKYFCVEQRIPYIIDEDGKHIESEWWVDVNYVPDSELYSGLRDGAAVAWMPLPLPYKQEVEG